MGVARLLDPWGACTALDLKPRTPGATKPAWNYGRRSTIAAVVENEVAGIAETRSAIAVDSKPVEDATLTTPTCCKNWIGARRQRVGQAPPRAAWGGGTGMATRSGVRAPRRSGPVRSPYSGNKMLTAMPGGVRLIPVAVRTHSASKGKGSRLFAWWRTRYQPVPPEDGYERAAGRRYRRAVARSLGGTADRFGPPSQPKTRMGIAIAAGRRMAQAHEDRARAVARALRLY